MSIPPVPSGQNHLLRNIVRFGRVLRALGIEVTPPQILNFVTGLKYIDIRRREDFKNTARVVLVNRPEHLPLFDRAFDLFWRSKPAGEPAWLETAHSRPAGRPRGKTGLPLIKNRRNGPGPNQEPAESHPAAIYTYSNRELLRHKDFARLTPAELAEIKQMMQAMMWRLEQRRTRRKAQAPRGSWPDMRRTFRQNLRYGGELLRLSWRCPRLKRRPLVVICDISGSMEQYARILLQFVYVISNGLEQVEAFVFSTRLTRITRHLKGGDVDLALDRVVSAARDWGGGTRIGAAVKTFNYVWGRRVLAQGAIVLVISDGLDRGDVGLLGREMHRLQLSCRRLVWLNPLLGSRDYRPLTRGIQAALPYIDDFLPVHNLASLEQLGRLLERLGEHRPWRPRYGRRPASGRPD